MFVQTHRARYNEMLEDGMAYYQGYFIIFTELNPIKPFLLPMKLLKTTILSFCLMVSLSSDSMAQIVQAFTFDSTTRDMMVVFPEGDHNQYEKILMHYTMRCKDGLVSTGADRNLGCGEWDYSCNTYITDPMRTDSFTASAPSHLITGNFSGANFEYALNPTYTYYQTELHQVNYTNTNNEQQFSSVGGSDQVAFPIGGESKNRKIQLLFPKDFINSSGLTAGEIDGISFDLGGGSGLIPRLKVKLANTTASNLDGSTIASEELTQVFYDDMPVNGSSIYIPFYDAFDWDGSSNILMEVSYSEADADDITLKGAYYAEGVTLNVDDANVGVNSEGRGNISIVENINYSGDEVTFAFWYKGSLEQPLNSTVFEGLDSEGRRQANVHLPWGNGIAYWDCGNMNNAYDRLNKTVDVDNDIIKWNHWAFTKNVTTGVMRIYLNGNSWFGGFSNIAPIDIQTLKILSSYDEVRYSHGALDDFYMLDKALSAEEVQSLMHTAMNGDHSLYDNLVLGFDFDGLETSSTTVTDISKNNYETSISGVLTPEHYLGYQFRQGLVSGDWLPNTTWFRGDYSIDVTDVVVYDSLQNAAYGITEYGVENNDLVIVDTYDRYLAGLQLVYDEDGEIIDLINAPADGIINITTLDYFSKRDMKFELLSFVTPYGIGIDFGLDGKTWTFDVTDFGPILKGEKRLTMERGGQFQEEMDIKFEFIQGTPVRDVIDITQVWPVTQEGYGRIVADGRFEPRSFQLNDQAEEFEIHAAITGHGQEGEFIPRTHFIDVNNGEYAMSWQVWKECADNPIYPQGGTWVYDRAGWCPGAPTDVNVLKLDGAAAGDAVTVDYGVTTATGDSRYIVNVQLVSYGQPNFQHDATLADIISPSSAAKNERFNPMCGSPIVMIKNTGSNDLTEATISYGIEGQSTNTYQWEGQLAFGEEVRVDLPPLSLKTTADGATFFAEIAMDNDEYGANDRLTSIVRPVQVHSDNIKINMYTNGQPNETRWRLLDVNGNMVASPDFGLSAFTLYTEEVNDLNGCYTLLITDTDGDGISWWANNDGDGFISITDEGGASSTIATDFGSIILYEFVTEGFNPTEENAVRTPVRVFPNPTSDVVIVDLAAETLLEDARLVDVSGRTRQVIAKESINPGLNEVALGAHAAGIYHLELVTNAGKQSFRVVIL